MAYDPDALRKYYTFAVLMDNIKTGEVGEVRQAFAYTAAGLVDPLSRTELEAAKLLANKYSRRLPTKKDGLFGPRNRAYIAEIVQSQLEALELSAT